MTRLRIDVPASSANLGPGFDCLALALDIVDVITVEFDPAGAGATLGDVTGGAGRLDPKDNLICRAYRAWAEDSGTTLPGARFSLTSHIPVGKGLGSSAAALVAGLTAAAFAADDKAPRDRILRLATSIEGHADNVAATTLGGVTTAFRDGEAVHALHLANHLTLGVALFIPDGALPTREARAILPQSVPMADAVFDIGRATYLSTALIWGKWDLIGHAMCDRLHQPYRARLMPALEPVIAAAREAGAYGAALSGAGPAVIALGPRDAAEGFAAAMESTARARGWTGKGLVAAIRAGGVRVTKEEG